MITPSANSLVSVAYSSYSFSFPWYSMTFCSYSVECSTSFHHVLSLTQQISSGVYKSTYLYLFCTLDLHNTCIASLLSWVTCSKAYSAFALSLPCRTRAHQALDYFYKSMSYFEGCFALLPLLVLQVYVLLWRTLCSSSSTVCDARVTPWSHILDKIKTTLDLWATSNPTLNTKQLIIQMVVGGSTQFLTKA